MDPVRAEHGGLMRLAALLCLLLSACNLGQLKDSASRCLGSGVSMLARDLVPSVNDALRAGNWQDKMADLGSRAAADVLTCAVREAVGAALLSDSRAIRIAAADPDRVLIRDHGIEWLRKRGGAL